MWLLEFENWLSPTCVLYNESILVSLSLIVICFLAGTFQGDSQSTCILYNESTLG